MDKIPTSLPPVLTDYVSISKGEETPLQWCDLLVTTLWKGSNLHRAWYRYLTLKWYLSQQWDELICGIRWKALGCSCIQLYWCNIFANMFNLHQIMEKQINPDFCTCHQTTSLISSNVNVSVIEGKQKVEGMLRWWATRFNTWSVI